MTDRTRVILQLAAVCIAGALLGWWLSPRGEAPTTPAPSAPTLHIQEPYGGCKEAALYEGTSGYELCRQLGRLPD